MQFAEIARIQVNKRVTKKVEKTILIMLLIGFITLTIMWIPKLIVNGPVKGYPAMADEENVVERYNNSDGMRNFSSTLPLEENQISTKKPFDWQKNITWVVSTIQGILLLILTAKKVLNKG